MRIQKKFQGTIPDNKILDTYSESQTDTYSCNKINEFFENNKIDLTDYVKEEELKTINGQSLIGEGDIKIEGGSGGTYEPNMMTIVNIGKQTLKKEEYNKVIFNDVLSSVGDKLELVDGGIKIGAGVKKIKLSAYSTIVTTDGYGVCHLRLMKNEYSNDNSICWLIGNTINAWGQVTLTYPSSIVEVNEGDIICMYIYTASTGQTGADNNVPTSNITAEVIE